MSVICYECKNTNSSASVACGHCGNPILRTGDSPRRKSSFLASCVGFLFVITVLVAGVAGLAFFTFSGYEQRALLRLVEVGRIDDAAMLFADRTLVRILHIAGVK